MIGGMSWQSSAEYYKLINQMVSYKLGGLHSARLVMFSVDFYEIERAQHQNRWEVAADILSEAGLALKSAGADFLVLCTNTMHKVAETVEQKSGLPLLHICDVTSVAIARQNLRVVGLLGTRFTMEEEFYRSRLEEKSKAKVLIPDEKSREAIHRTIYEELCKGVVSEASRRRCVRIIGRMVERGVEGVVLACTELPLLLRGVNLGIPLFNTTELHAKAAVDTALTS